MNILDRIQNMNDIQDLDEDEYDILAYEIRRFLIDHVSKTGGHLASNLGAVELTIALHLCMHFPEDKLIFDVGHQAYTHKILTGRKEEFENLRQYDGLSGFPKTEESDADVFDTGHSSTSISAAIGFAEARALKGTHERIAAVIGDGSFSGGMVFEALNNMSDVKGSLIVILNDNEMSISKPVGGMSNYLNHIRLGHVYNEFKSGVEHTLLSIPKRGMDIARRVKQSKDSIKQLLIPGKFFEDLGITYIGPVDGHDIVRMRDTITAAMELNKPILIHVKTKKGKGYGYAERHPSYFHGVAPFDPDTGKVLVKKQRMSYTDVFGREMIRLGAEHKDLIAVTAAMPDGTGLTPFKKAYPERFFDVGIAEQHAVTFAAGLAASGLIPVVAVYSSFLQRAYDQILHDVCLQKLHVIFAVDRAGLVGADGETHQGIFDLSYLSHIPNMTVMAPKNRYELSRMLEFAVQCDGPVAIRYPRGDAYQGLKNCIQYMDAGKSEVIYQGSRVALLAVGSMVARAERVYEILKAHGVEATLVNARFVKPLDTELLDSLMRTHSYICTMEENVLEGGYGQAVATWLLSQGYTFTWIPFAIPDTFVKQGTVDVLLDTMGLGVEQMADTIRRRIGELEE